MPHSLDQILPSLEALGLWSYWIIGAASMLEAFFATGAFVPGTLVVDAGGMLVQQGALDFIDLLWFVAIGSILGAEAGYWAGRLARHYLKERWQPEKSPSYRRAEQLFARRGGLALVIGRFLGPLSGLVPLAAALSGMERRRFLIWNIVSGVPYAIGHVAFGYFLGDVITRLGPFATRLVLFAAAVAAVIALLWWLIIRIERLLPFVLSVTRSIIGAVAENPDIRAWAARHPRLAGLIGSRLDMHRFGGLTATLLALVMIYIFVIWLGVVLDFLMSRGVVQIDMRLAELIHAFWSPALLRFFAHVTALGDWRVVTPLLLAVLGLLYLRRRADLALGLGSALVGNLASVWLLKRIFDRPRPELAYFVETSGSFPSGHAAISIAFYGMLFYIALRLKRLGPISAALLAATLAFMVGLSRVYLIEHYLSDVLNGWLVGALWLVVGISIAEWWRDSHPTPGKAVAAVGRRIILPIAAGLVVVSGWTVLSYDKTLNLPRTPPPAETVADIGNLFSTGRLAGVTETLTGRTIGPINVIVVARDRQALETALARAGWVAVARPGIVSLGRTVLAGWLGNFGENAPVAPFFWQGRPNDLAFRRTGPGTAARQATRRRHHARIWETPFHTVSGERIFTVAASFDKGLGWGLSRLIAPDVDAERALLVNDLSAAGMVGKRGTLRIAPPRPIDALPEGTWFSDGKAALVRLR